MGSRVLVARVRITNTGGVFDSMASAGSGADGIRIAATTSASLADAPNTATVSIYNLAPDTIARITGVLVPREDWTPEQRAELLAAGASTAPPEAIADRAGLARIELYWGYVDSEAITRATVLAALQLGFLGDSKTMTEVPSGDDAILRIEALDAGHTLGAAEVVQLAGPPGAFESKSYIAGTPLASVVVDLVNAAGLSADLGAVEAAIVAALAARGLPGAEAVLLGPKNVSGPARPHLAAIFRGLGLRWSVQRGELVVLAARGVIPGYAPLVLSAATANIIGESTVIDGGGRTASTWADAKAIPGRAVTYQPASGTPSSYRIDTAATTIDTDTGGSTSLGLDALQVVGGLF